MTGLQVDKVVMHASARRGVAGQMVRYGMAARCGCLVAIAVYAGKPDVGGPAYPPLAVAFVPHGLVNLSLVSAWAFPPPERPLRSDRGRFCAVAAIDLAANCVTFAVLYAAIGRHATVTERLAILIASPLTYFARRLSPGRYTFTASSHELDRTPQELAAIAAPVLRIASVMALRRRLRWRMRLNPVRTQTS